MIGTERKRGAAVRGVKGEKASTSTSTGVQRDRKVC